jgi:hypothetical protein
MESDNIVLEHLRAISLDIGRLFDEVDGLKTKRSLSACTASALRHYRPTTVRISLNSRTARIEPKRVWVSVTDRGSR